MARSTSTAQRFFPVLFLFALGCASARVADLRVVYHPELRHGARKTTEMGDPTALLGKAVERRTWAYSVNSEMAGDIVLINETNSLHPMPAPGAAMEPGAMPRTYVPDEQMAQLHELFNRHGLWGQMEFVDDPATEYVRRGGTRGYVVLEVDGLARTYFPPSSDDLKKYPSLGERPTLPPESEWGRYQPAVRAFWHYARNVLPRIQAMSINFNVAGVRTEVIGRGPRRRTNRANTPTRRVTDPREMERLLSGKQAPGETAEPRGADPNPPRDSRAGASPPAGNDTPTFQD